MPAAASIKKNMNLRASPMRSAQASKRRNHNQMREPPPASSVVPLVIA